MRCFKVYRDIPVVKNVDSYYVRICGLVVGYGFDSAVAAFVFRKTWNSQRFGEM